MKIFFEKRLSAWLDRFVIWNEKGEVIFQVKGVMAMAQKFMLLDAEGNEIGMVKETMNIGTQFNLIHNNEKIGTVKKKGLFGSQFVTDYKDWTVEGDIVPWSYRIQSADGQPAAVLGKDLVPGRNAFGVEITNPEDLIPVIMVILAVDSERCTSGRRDVRKEIKKDLEKDKAESKAKKRGKK